MSQAEPVIAHPAATVVLLRDGPAGCELLMLRRNAELAFHGGAWVFPGGRVDAEDYDLAADAFAAAKRAAVREAREEAGVDIRADDLVTISRWITPEVLPKRFDTWFFATPAGGQAVAVDGHEIDTHRWMRAEDVLAAHRSGELTVVPPTYITVLSLSRFQRLEEALTTIAKEPVETFFPRIRPTSDGVCSVYHGDAAYEGADLEHDGPRHRMWMGKSGYRYERSL